MVNNIQYTNIKRVLDNLLDHPMMKDVSLEQAVRYVLRFIALHGYPALYEDKIGLVQIDRYRGVLPCDLIRIEQVRDARSKQALRAMTDTFTPALLPSPAPSAHIDLTNNVRQDCGTECHPPFPGQILEASYKTQGRLIYTSFPHGEVEVAYKAIPVDEEGFPLLIDNEVYLEALEAFIKEKVFTVKFDLGKISLQVLQNAQQEYAWAAGKLQSEMKLPGISEMEAISRMWNTLIPQTRHFDSSFKHLGDREYLVQHPRR